MQGSNRDIQIQKLFGFSHLIDTHVIKRGLL